MVDEYVIHGLRPRYVAFPASENQVAAVLTEASRCRIAVVPTGAGTHLGIGNVPTRYDVALSTRRLDALIDHEPDDLTVTVAPGVSMDRLEAHLAEHRQFLPLDPPGTPNATVGGLLATNGFGPLRHKYGTARDWLIGLRVVGADGRPTKSGGRVVKNVAGYDVHKLHVGALGTLGVITEATFKLTTLPAADIAVFAPCGNAADACTTALRADDAQLSIATAEVVSPAAARQIFGEAHWGIGFRVAGAHAAVERSLRELRTLCAELRETPPWHPAWGAAFGDSSQLMLRAAVAPAAVSMTVEALARQFSSDVFIALTPVSGVIRIRADVAPDEARQRIDGARAAVALAGGALSVDAAPLAVTREIDVFGPGRADLAIMRRLKHALDPRGILAPGRFAGRI
jgi:glycolate oxidase FAD binding subunit